MWRTTRRNATHGIVPALGLTKTRLVIPQMSLPIGMPVVGTLRVCGIRLISELWCGVASDWDESLVSLIPNKTRRWIK